MYVNQQCTRRIKYDYIVLNKQSRVSGDESETWTAQFRVECAFHKIKIIKKLHAQKLVWNALLLHVICTVCICIHFSCVLNGDIMNLSNQSLSVVS